MDEEGLASSGRAYSDGQRGCRIEAAFDISNGRCADCLQPDLPDGAALQDARGFDGRRHGEGSQDGGWEDQKWSLLGSAKRREVAK